MGRGLETVAADLSVIQGHVEVVRSIAETLNPAHGTLLNPARLKDRNIGDILTGRYRRRAVLKFSRRNHTEPDS